MCVCKCVSSRKIRRIKFEYKKTIELTNKKVAWNDGNGDNSNNYSYWLIVLSKGSRTSGNRNVHQAHSYILLSDSVICSLSFLLVRICHPSIGRTEAEAPKLWSPDANSWLIGKDPDAGKNWRQKEKRTTENEMVGQHHRVTGRELGQTPGDVRDRGLACCSPRGRKE